MITWNLPKLHHENDGDIVNVISAQTNEQANTISISWHAYILLLIIDNTQYVYKICPKCISKWWFNSLQPTVPFNIDCGMQEVYGDNMFVKYNSKGLGMNVKGRMRANKRSSTARHILLWKKKLLLRMM